jgi:hypothetical protein
VPLDSTGLLIAEASEPTFMLARVPVLPQFCDARMSSMARSRMAIGLSPLVVNRTTSLSRAALRWRSAAFVADRRGDEKGLLVLQPTSG